MSYNQNNKILEECIDNYKNKLEKYKFPITSTELKKIQSEIIELILQEFHSKTIGDNKDNIEERLLEELQQKFQLFKKKNITESKKISEMFLDNYRIQIKKELKNSNLKTKYDLKERLDEIKHLYEDEEQAGPATSVKDKL